MLRLFSSLVIESEHRGEITCQGDGKMVTLVTSKPVDLISFLHGEGEKNDMPGMAGMTAMRTSELQNNMFLRNLIG